jgi:hypothetical protein
MIKTVIRDKSSLLMVSFRFISLFPSVRFQPRKKDTPEPKEGQLSRITSVILANPLEKMSSVSVGFPQALLSPS